MEYKQLLQDFQRIWKRSDSMFFEFDEMFERGIDPDVDDPAKCHSHSKLPTSWPSMEEILDYVKQTRHLVSCEKSFQSVAELAGTNTMAKDGRVFHLAMEHELMHQETFYYMYQQLDKRYKQRPSWAPAYLKGSKCRDKKCISIPAGQVQLGATESELVFGWDNEFPSQLADVPAFDIDDLPVTNGEFLEFVTSGAYENKDYWRAEDWEWKQRNDMRHPVFWKRDNNNYHVYCIFGEEIDIQEVSAWPVNVSWAEASAYAKWKGRSLPTEAQYQRVAYTSPENALEKRRYPWGNDDITPEHANVNWTSWGPSPTGSHPKGASAWGVEDLVGDGWELTSTVFGPLPGFVAMPAYPGYSTDFFDGKHYVLKGGSWATDAKLIRPSFRNWYQDRYPYMFAKFRLVNNH